MSGDTKPYREEIDKASVATRSMKADIGGQLNDLSSLFGINLNTIGQMSQKVSTAFEGLTSAMGKAFTAGKANKEATEGLTLAQKAQAIVTGVVTVATKLLGVAIAATGIGLLIVALGSLVGYFSQTAEGAKMLKVWMAELGAIVTTLKNHFTSFGEGLVKFFKGDTAGSAEAFGKAFKGLGSDIANNADHAGELARQTAILNKEERDNIVIQQERMTKAAELRNDAKQEGVTAEEKKKMLAEAKRLIIEYYDEEKHIAKGRSDIFSAELGDRKAMGDELTKEQELKAKVLQIDQESAEAQKALSREMKAANKEIAAQTAEILKKNEAERKKDIAKVDTLRGFKPQETLRKQQSDIDKDEDFKKVQEKNNKLFEKNEKHLSDVRDNAFRKLKSTTKETTQQYIDLSSSVQTAAANVAISTGEMLGNLLSGQGGIQNFGTIVSGAFADLAVTVGKQMIQFGTAGIALQKLTMSPWTAVAAGIALVALGTMAKNSISSSLSGGGVVGAMSSGAQNFNFDTRSTAHQAKAQNINVNVSGTLTASAKGLVTTLSRENTRVTLST